MRSPRSIVHAPQIYFIETGTITIKKSLQHIGKTQVLQISHSQIQIAFCSEAHREQGAWGRCPDRKPGPKGHLWAFPQSRPFSDLAVFLDSLREEQSKALPMILEQDKLSVVLLSILFLVQRISMVALG